MTSRPAHSSFAILGFGLATLAVIAMLQSPHVVNAHEHDPSMDQRLGTQPQRGNESTQRLQENLQRYKPPQAKRKGSLLFEAAPRAMLAETADIDRSSPCS